MDDLHISRPAAALDYQPAPATHGADLLSAAHRKLLRIEVPVTITLASKKESVGAIVNLAPGTILRFDKSCDEELDLEIGTRRIAQGECVQVGGRLGLRINALIPPNHRSNV